MTDRFSRFTVETDCQLPMDLQARLVEELHTFVTDRCKSWGGKVLVNVTGEVVHGQE